MSDQRFGLIAGRYALRDQLGHGGMGRVWLAHDEMLDRDVAIKEVSPPSPLSAEESDLLRYLIFREARAAGRINHQHVVKIYDVIETERWPWLVMEYVRSTNLQRAVNEGGPMSPAKVAKIGLAILEALVAAHNAGVLHRDVKPDNVLVADDGRVVLGDFGLASLDADGKITRTGQLGTPQYVAPERARHGLSSREADYWSLGATLYAAVEGRSPYGRESVLETLAALAVDDPDPMRLAGPLAPVLTGLLRRDPAARTKPDVLAEQLRKVMAGETLPPAPTPPMILAVDSASRRSSKGRTAAVAAIASLVTIAGGFLLTRGGFLDELPDPPLAGSGVSTPTVAGVGLLACDQSPLRPSRVPLEVPPPKGDYPLLKDWEWFTLEPTFATSVPDTWGYWRAGETVCFRDPHSSRVLAVVKGRSEIAKLPDYREERAEEIMRAEKEKLVEFTYTGLDQNTRFVCALFTANFTVLWSGENFDTGQSRSYFGVVRAAFRDLAGRASASPAQSR